MIELPDTCPHRMQHHAALSQAYHLPEKVPLFHRFAWLIAMVAWLICMVMVAAVLPHEPGALPWWWDGFSGNLIAGAIGSVLFVFLGLQLGQQHERGQEQTRVIVEAFAARLFERDRVTEFETCMYSGELGDVAVARPRSGPDELLYHVRSARDPNGSAPLMYGSPSEKIYVALFTAPPMLATKNEHREAYEKSAIKSGQHYFCRFQGGAWHMADSMTSSEWFEFGWMGRSGEMATGTTADEFVNERRQSSR